MGNDDPHTGVQSDEKMAYAAYMRAKQELVVFLQDTHGAQTNIKTIYRGKGGMLSSVAWLATCVETIKKLKSPYVLLNLDGSSSGSAWATLNDDELCPDNSWTLPHWQAIQWAKRTATWIRHSFEQMVLVVKGVWHGPAYP